MPIIANLVVGLDGATTINGSSAPLSTGSDRQRFHAIRGSADLIVIGGNTSETEPYQKTPVPLIVITHHDQIPGSAFNNPTALISHQSIAATLKEFAPRYKTILVEGGATLLMEALEESLVDTLYLTQVDRQGEGPHFSLPQEAGLTLTEEESSLDGQDLFLTFARLPR